MMQLLFAFLLVSALAELRAKRSTFGHGTSAAPDAGLGWENNAINHPFGNGFLCLYYHLFKTIYGDLGAGLLLVYPRCLYYT
jgi:hypothetical protein